MLSTNRKFHLKGELKIKKSKLTDAIIPKDDKVNWLFLTLKGIDYSFVYKIEDPENARYNTSFKILLAFTAFDLIQNILEIDKTYKVKRGQEDIGTVILQGIINYK